MVGMNDRRCGTIVHVNDHGAGDSEGDWAGDEVRKVRREIRGGTPVGIFCKRLGGRLSNPLGDQAGENWAIVRERVGRETEPFARNRAEEIWAGDRAETSV